MRRGRKPDPVSLDGSVLTNSDDPNVGTRPENDSGHNAELFEKFADQFSDKVTRQHSLAVELLVAAVAQWRQAYSAYVSGASKEFPDKSWQRLMEAVKQFGGTPWTAKKSHVKSEATKDAGRLAEFINANTA